MNKLLRIILKILLTRLMVGDNSHDIECAHAAGVRSVAVGWAMRGSDYLKTYHPTYIINEAKELVDIVKKEGI